MLFAYMENKTEEELGWDSESVLREKGQCWGAEGVKCKPSVRASSA